jgi:hypothetical protein
MHLLRADLNEPCPWKRSERESWIFVWSTVSVVLYPIGMPVLVLALLVHLELPRLARFAQGEAIFQQMITTYIKQRNQTVCCRIATWVGGQKDDAQPQADLVERAAQLFRDVSDHGKHAVTSTRFLDWLTGDVTGDYSISSSDREEMEQIFLHFDEDGNGALDESEILQVSIPYANTLVAVWRCTTSQPLCCCCTSLC